MGMMKTAYTRLCDKILANLIAREYNIGPAVLMTGLALFMTRPAKRKENLAIWTDKWSGAETPAEQLTP